MVNEPQAGHGVDPERPSIARIYDSYLGGGHHQAADLDARRQVIEVMPELPALLRISLAFMQRGVRFLAEAGIRSFLDLGAGIPTIDNVHEIAQAVDPTARTVYVDNDPLAVRERRILTAGDSRTLVLERDLREADAILGEPETARLLGLGTDEPIAVVMSSVLQFIPDDDEVVAVIAAYRDAMAPGSYLMISHGVPQPGSAQRLLRAAELYSQTIAPLKLRSAEQLAELVRDFELIEPGIAYCSQWRPDPAYRAAAAVKPLAQMGLVARKP
jgi:SAM-dependent methyltransferase